MYRHEKSDCSEAFKMDELHEIQVSKLKKKHTEMEKLEQKNASLLESLSRKEQSLNHALKALNEANNGLNSTVVDPDVVDTKQDELEVGIIDDNRGIGAKNVVQLQMQSLKSKIMNKIHKHTQKKMNCNCHYKPMTRSDNTMQIEFQQVQVLFISKRTIDRSYHIT